MKKIRLHLKFIALVLISIMTLPSCSVYYTETASVDEALLSDNKVKIITTTNDIYKFEKLQTEDDQVYGVTRKKSSTAKKFSNEIVSIDSDSKFVKISLEEIIINEIHLKNKGASTAVNVVIPVVIVGVLVGVGVHSANNITVGDWSN